MAVDSHLDVVGEWLRLQLEEPLSLECYDGVHPGFDQGYDEVIVYNLNRGSDTKYANGIRAWYEAVMQVKAIVKGNRPTRANELMELIDVNLHNKKNQPLINGWRIYECLFDIPITYTETGSDGEVYRHAGGLYKIKIRKEAI